MAAVSSELSNGACFLVWLTWDQIPGYNAYEEIDHLNDCFVPHDLAWTETERDY